MENRSNYYRIHEENDDIGNEGMYPVILSIFQSILMDIFR